MGTIIVDLDGTLCNHDHRKHLAEAKDWDGYNSRLHGDTVNSGVSVLMEAMACYGHRVDLCTGRDEAYRTQTVKWLHDNNIGWWDELYMRPTGNRQPDWEYKQGILTNQLAGKDILFVVEDRKQVVDMWRRNGILTFQCAEGDF